MDHGDRNKNAFCNYVKEKSPSCVIRKIVAILEHQVTRYDIERQKELVYQYAEISKCGFLVTDLNTVMRVIELMLERLLDHEEYGKLLEKILQICSVPPILTKSSDILTFDRVLQEYFSMLGYSLVCLQTEYLQNLVAGALINLLKIELRNQRYYVSLSNRKRFAENSRLPEILGQLLQLADENIYPKILCIVFLLASESDKTCKALLSQDALNSLFTRLEPTWKERYPDTRPPLNPIDNILHYEKVSRIIWMLLKYMSKKKNDLGEVKTVTLYSLWSIQYVFRLFALSSKFLDRNNMLMMIIKLLQLFPKLDFVKSGLAEDLIYTSLSPFHDTSWAANVALTLIEADYTYLKLLLTSLPYYVKCPGGIRVLEYHGVTRRLLRFSRNMHLVQWPQQQACVIQIIVMSVLKNIVPYIEEEFIENAGPAIILRTLKNYYTNESDMKLLKKGLETLYFILRNTHMVVHSVLFNDGLNLILDLCDKIMSNLTDVALKQKCLGFIFSIMSILYKHAPTTNNSKMIDLTLRYMKQILEEAKEPVEDSRVIICVMDFIWEHISKSDENSHEFVKKGGAFLMLDIIQSFPFAVQIVTLGALVDLCENGFCIPYLITWKRNGQKIIPLLMEIFKEENRRLKVKCEPTGQIAEARCPLMGSDQKAETVCRCKGEMGNPAVTDLFVSCRPKIYAILQMLNDRHKETLEAANEHYKSYGDELQAKHQVTLLLAENFLALKLGEAWIELKMELERKSITLTPIDNKILSSLTERTIKWGAYLQKVQHDILQTDLEKERKGEQKLYSFLEEGRLSDALEALSELKYIARSSENLFRISQKFIQNSQIENSLTSRSEDLHKTFFATIRVTPVFNKNVSVKNDIIVTAEEDPIVPVSPTVSYDECEINIPEDLLQSSEEVNKNTRE